MVENTVENTFEKTAENNDNANEAQQEKKVSFEEALAKLEKIVAAIESGEISLENSIAQYARGVELVRRCRAILQEAEKKIQLLARDENGNLRPSGSLDVPEDEI